MHGLMAICHTQPERVDTLEVIGLIILAPLLYSTLCRISDHLSICCFSALPSLNKKQNRRGIAAPPVRD